MGLGDLIHADLGDIVNSAVISPCEVYRYELRRTFAPELAFTTMVPNRPLVACILNPSVADDKEDDPTIRKVSDSQSAGDADGLS